MTFGFNPKEFLPKANHRLEVLPCEQFFELNLIIFEIFMKFRDGHAVQTSK